MKKSFITKGAVTPESQNKISNSSINPNSKNIITKGGITPYPLDKMFSNEEGYEIEIKEENNELLFDVVEEETNKRYVSKINLPEGITLSDLFDSLEKHFYQIINKENNIEIVMLFNKDGSSIQKSFTLSETNPTPGQEILKDEKSIFSSLYQDKYIKKNNFENSQKKSNNNSLNDNFENKEKTPLGTPLDSTQDVIGALFNLKILDDPYVNQYHRIYIISKELNQLIKINLKNTPNLFVTKHEMEIDIQKNKENSKYFIISLLQDLLEKAGIKTVVERKCEQPELASDLLQMIVSGIGLLPVYVFHTDYGERENYNILTNENVQKNFVENWKNKLAKSLKIDPRVIFICDFRKGSLKFNVFLGKQLNDEEINRLKNEYPNEFVNEGIKFGEFLLQSCKLSIEMFEPKYNNYDSWAPKGEMRGGEPYDSPLTWRGFGLKVLGKYDNGDNTWIGMQNKPGEFPVAYHGIGCNSNNPFPIAGRIVDEGFIIGKRQFYYDSPDIRHPGRNCGFGAYFTPSIDEAGSYAGTGNFNGKRYKIVFMCRVRKENIREPNRNNQPKYWILDGTKNEVRPYRILIKEE